MRADSSWTEEQPGSDLVVAQPLSHQSQHFTLALRQHRQPFFPGLGGDPLSRELGDEAPGDPRREQRLASGDYPDGMQQLGRSGILIVVFAAIVPSDQVFIKAFALGMVAAILVDATIIRMLLVPAHLLGRSNWWLPRILERRLPQLLVEGAPDAFLRPVADAQPVPSR